ncbi:FGGY-family carbohydrate kinase [Psychrobacter sp. FDAARGOS_221]|uniref:FGGY-family carbohydrate kinase n=1 Tax=Psychrobacter sp. FDAARGOS_221 TaxID=1975705 RepID=UPI000BB55EFB|nr:FGGY-family carbohydrate kinase [Psychrobacter sp. FDAARGOS_221]PNK60783.1 carbohydrate kinase [Psychrobacter sp. FDAARGOS_221]
MTDSPTKPIYLLAIDNGTQSVRALIFDQFGTEIAKARVPIEPYFSTQPSFAEQHADYYWQKLSEACQQLWQSCDIKPSQIAGVSLATQRYTMLCLDKDKKPLRPAIVWMDLRQGKPKNLGILGAVTSVIGMGDLVKEAQQKARCNWIAHHEPDIWRKTAYYVNLSAYLTDKLTGELIDSAGHVLGYLPYDYKARTWMSPKNPKWRLFSCRPEQMPKIVAPGQPLGTISAEAAAATGIAEGTPMIAAASDKACEALGSAGLATDTACLSFGTTATINTTSQDYIEVLKHMPAYTAAAPDYYNHEYMVYRGFWMVSWFKEQFAHYEQQLAKTQGVDTEKLLDEAVKDIPAGCMGLMMQPYWSPGVRHPGLEGKGALIGFSDVHTRAHVYRAILEGLAYELKLGFDTIERRTGKRIKHLRVSGGGSQSDSAMQLTADIFGMPTYRPHTFEASGLGAAINCAVGLGIYPDHLTATEAMTRVGDEFLPIAKNVDLYQRLYNEVYLKMYERLQPLYFSIQKITGYPPL